MADTQQLQAELLAQVEAADSLGALEDVRVNALGKKGAITAQMKSLGALGQLADQYDSGADPAQVVEDLLELVHWLTRIKVTPAAAEAPGVPEMERTRGQEMAGGLTMAALTRAWQMLLKGLGEVRSAPSALQAAEMILVRLMYGLELPSPADALKKLQDAPPTPQPSAPQAGAPTSGGGASTSGGGGSVNAQGSSHSGGPTVTHGPTMSGANAAQQPQTHPLSMSEVELPDPLTFEHVVALTESLGEMILHANLISNVHLVSFQPGKIEYHPGDHAPQDLAQRLTKFLSDHTARRWVVTVSNQAGQPTLIQQKDAAAAGERAEAARDPLVRAVLEAFPGAEVTAVKDTIQDVAPLPAPPEDMDADMDADADGDDEKLGDD